MHRPHPRIRTHHSRASHWVYTHPSHSLDHRFRTIRRIVDPMPHRSRMGPPHRHSSCTHKHCNLPTHCFHIHRKDNLRHKDHKAAHIQLPKLFRSNRGFANTHKTHTRPRQFPGIDSRSNRQALHNPGHKSPHTRSRSRHPKPHHSRPNPKHRHKLRKTLPRLQATREQCSL